MQRFFILNLFLIWQFCYGAPPKSIEDAFFMFLNPNSNLLTMRSCITYLSKQNLKSEELDPLVTFADRLENGRVAVPDLDRIQAIGETGRLEAAKVLLKGWEKRQVDADYEQYSELELRYIRKIYTEKSQNEATVVDQQISEQIASQIDASNTMEHVEPLYVIAHLISANPAFDFKRIENEIAKKAVTAKNPEFQKWLGIIVARLNRGDLINTVLENKQISPTVLSNMITRLSSEWAPLLQRVAKNHPAAAVKEAANSNLEKIELHRKFREQMKDSKACDAILTLLNSMKGIDK